MGRERVNTESGSASNIRRTLPWTSLLASDTAGATSSELLLGTLLAGGLGNPFCAGLGAAAGPAFAALSIAAAAATRPATGALSSEGCPRFHASLPVL